MTSYEMETTQLPELTTIEGIGEKIANKLHNGGIRTFSELAAATDEDLAAIKKDLVWKANQQNWRALAAHFAVNSPSPEMHTKVRRVPIPF